MRSVWSRRSVMGSLAAVALLPGAGRAVRRRGEERVALTTADGRSCAVTRWRAPVPRGTILFSHGALSAPSKYAALLAPWVAAGFDVWAPLHVDSTDHPDTRKYPGLASWPARMLDLRALAEHVGAAHYVAAGHSYGALVALTLGGASPSPPPGVPGPLRDRRARSVIAFSPPGPGTGLVDAAGYATLAVPALIETGTADAPPGTPPSPDAWRGHLVAYETPAPGGDRYALVLDGADHYFGNLICRPERPDPPQRMQLDRAVSVSRLFLAAFGRGSHPARAVLDREVVTGDGIGLHRR